MSYLSGLKQLDPSVKRHNGGGSSFTLDEIGTTQATRLVVGGVEQVPNVDFTVSGTTLSTTSATPSGTNNVVTFQYFKSGTVNTATAVSAGGVNNAAMADDAIGIAELSATGTASSSTFLRGDNAWAAPAGSSLAIYTDQEAAGSEAGENYSAGAFRTVTLNTEVLDADNIGSLSSNQITLGAGTYDVLCWFDTYGANFNQHNTFSRFRDTTNSTTLVVGTVAHQVGETAVATGQGGGVRVEGRFTLSGSAACEFQIYPVSYITSNKTGTTDTGEVNIACLVKLEKL